MKNIANLFCEQFGPPITEPNGDKVNSRYEKLIIDRSWVAFNVAEFFFEWCDLHRVLLTSIRASDGSAPVPRWTLPE